MKIVSGEEGFFFASSFYFFVITILKPNMPTVQLNVCCTVGFLFTRTVMDGLTLMISCLLYRFL